MPCVATWKSEFQLPWSEAGPPHHHDDIVDSDQYVVNKEFSLSGMPCVAPAAPTTPPSAGNALPRSSSGHPPANVAVSPPERGRFV